MAKSPARSFPKTHRNKSKSALRYSFDPSNRLKITNARDRLGPVRILDGRIGIDSANRLLYHVETKEEEANLPYKHIIELDGNWRLSPNHELALSLHESQTAAHQTLFLKGALVKADANTLVFALRQEGDEDGKATQQVSLRGRWQADSHNRLNFLVSKADGAEDPLVLQGGWELGAHNEVIYKYKYRQKPYNGQADEEHVIAFDGAWDLTRENRLSYRISGSQDSAFEFKASLESPSLLASDGRIVYQLGIGIAGRRTQYRRISLYGTWKLNRNLSVSFEIPYAKGRAKAVTFEGTYALSRRDSISVSLHNREREPLGITVTFTKDLLPDVGLFLQLRKEADESSLIGGLRARF